MKQYKSKFSSLSADGFNGEEYKEMFVIRIYNCNRGVVYVWDMH